MQKQRWNTRYLSRWRRCDPFITRLEVTQYVTEPTHTRLPDTSQKSFDIVYRLLIYLYLT
jgi:hypothetical protein